jgi:hypothetical protein
LTRRGTTLVRLVLLDADVVIRLFEMGIWEKLVTQTRVTLAQQVFDQAQHYYDPETMARKRINLQQFLDQNRIDVLDCEAQEVAEVRGVCCKFADLHTGELESLAILNRPEQNTVFCTADRGAVRAAVMLGLTEKIISLEELLRLTSLQRDFDGRDNWQYSEQTFQRVVKQAGIDKVQGFGTAKP